MWVQGNNVWYSNLSVDVVTGYILVWYSNLSCRCGTGIYLSGAVTYPVDVVQVYTCLVQ